MELTILMMRMLNRTSNAANHKRLTTLLQCIVAITYQVETTLVAAFYSKFGTAAGGVVEINNIRNINDKKKHKLDVLVWKSETIVSRIMRVSEDKVPVGLLVERTETLQESYHTKFDSYRFQQLHVASWWYSLFVNDPLLQTILLGPNESINQTVQNEFYGRAQRTRIRTATIGNYAATRYTRYCLP